MHPIRSIRQAVVAAALGLVPAGFATAADPSITLRLAFYADADHPMARPAQVFMEQVETRSNGSVTIEFVPDAGADRTPVYEEGVATLLVDGGADLALTTTRSLDAAGVTSLRALHAPMLIDDLPLAIAVAHSELTATLLADMSSAGMTGLALWPEDLEHPVTFLNCTDRLTDPAQFEGLQVRIVAADAIEEIITTLGATPLFIDDYGDEVIRCELDAGVVGLRRTASLPGPTPVTGDITLYPRFGVLAVNNDSWARLTAAQQQIVRDAAIVARDTALGEVVSEADAAIAWCSQGGEVVIAGPENVERFSAALQPITDRLLADPVAGPAITEIERIAASIAPEPTLEACGGVEASPTPAPTPFLRSTDGYVGTMIPNGTYRAEVTTESLRANGASENFALRNGGVFTFTVQDGTTGWSVDGGPPCPGTIESDGTVVMIREVVPDTCVGGDMLWRPHPDGFEWYLAYDPAWPVVDYNDVAAFFDRVWIRID